MTPFFCSLVVVAGLGIAPADTVPWHGGLCLGRGDLWHGRLSIQVRNDMARAAKGDPVALVVGRGPRQADLAGVQIESLRICDDGGQEVLYNVIGPEGHECHTGPMAEGSRLVLPAQCAAGAAARYWAYFDNPSAWGVPDWLPASLGVRNSGFELDPVHLSATAGPRESLTMTQRGADAPWFEDPAAGDVVWDYRIPVQVANFSDTPERTGLISVDLAGVLARLRGKVDRANLRTVVDTRVVRSYQLKDLLLIEGEPVPPRTVQTYYVYLATATEQGYEAPGIPAADAAAAAPAPAAELAAGGPDYETLLTSPGNLVRNPSFEAGGELPDNWLGGAAADHPPAVEMRAVAPGLFGARCVRLRVPQDCQPNWYGWRQDVPVAPGRSYLLAAWLRCEDLQGGLQLHAHYRNAAGELCATAQMTSLGPAINGTVGWTLLSGLFTMPEDVAHFQLHLTMDARGTAWHDGAVLVEASAGQIGPLQARASAVDHGVRAWPVNPVVKVFQDDVPPRDVEPARISMARNEYEPLQLAIRSDRQLTGVQVQVVPPRRTDGAALGDPEIGVVGYVPIDYPTNYYNSKTPAWVRKYPTTAPACDGWAGYWPDPLLPRDRFDLAARSTQPVWITFRTAADTAPGDYTGTVRFVCGGEQVACASLTVHVWDFALPRENHVGAIYDLRMSSRWDIPGKAPEEARRDFLKFMADRRVCPDTIEPAPDIRYENGQVIADFTAFDRAAHYALDELGMMHFYTPWYFYLFGWGFPPSVKFGEKPYDGDYPFADVDRSKLRPQFKQAYQAVLKTYWDHLKARGWDKKCVLYISDEPFYTQPGIIEQMQALCEMIHEVDPEIRIYCSTWAHIPEWDGYITCWGLGHYGIVAPDVIARRRAAGDRIRWTTDGQMCTDTPYCAIERLLPAYCFHYGAEAYEFWGINWLTYDPYKWGWHSYIAQSDTPENSYFVRYPNGDGFLAYPGAPIGQDGPVTSIRLEQAREGCEDYEYLYLLRALIERAKAAGQDTAAAEQAMARAAQLVTIPNAGGRYSTRILPDPDLVFTVRRRVAEAIEQLNDAARHTGRAPH